MLSSSSSELEQEQIRIKKKPNGTGRKKIEMKKIEKNSSRKVAFSKRRKGLFKKGSELCRLCDARIAIIVFSARGRVYTSGYPSADTVLDQFLSKEDEEEEPEVQNQHNVGDERGSISLLNEENCENDCESENSGAEEGREGEEEEEYWWEESIEGLELKEIERRKACMEELRCNMNSSLEEMIGRRLYEKDLFTFLSSERLPR